MNEWINGWEETNKWMNEEINGNKKQTEGTNKNSTGLFSRKTKEQITSSGIKTVFFPLPANNSLSALQPQTQIR